MNDEQLSNDWQIIKNTIFDFQNGYYYKQFSDINKFAKHFVVSYFGINVQTSSNGYLTAKDGYNLDDLREAKRECEGFIINSYDDDILTKGYKAILDNINAVLNHYMKPQIKAVAENEQNPFPQIFTGTNNKTFTLFETFSNQHIVDKYTDFSFIFQQMKFNGYISDIKHLKFMKWLHENNYLNNDEYSVFVEQSTFRTLKKCAFGTRVNLYLKLQNEIILSSSDLSE